MKPTVNVLYSPGSNCQVETIRAFEQVGAAPRLLFLADVLSGAARLDSADLLCIPGGFSFGDHAGAGTVMGLILRTRLAEQFRRCSERPMLGICNGFQIIVRAGRFGPHVALLTNASGTFVNEPNQRHIVATGTESLWLAGLGGQTLVFPCAHGEGRFVYEPEGDAPSWRPALHYPDDMNPDGSTSAIAGITSTDGLAFGLMDHPERSLDPEVRLAFFENGTRAAVAV